jgi:16S rRNA (guanine(966)-N(2))-methyltransferase RsmD
MRVIAGQFRSRRLKTLRGMALRPTPDRLRESLFNVLAPRIQGCTFVDAYAGCGAVGIEALSRGAARAVFIESSRAAVRVIEENLTALGIRERAEMVHGSVGNSLRRFPADIVFLDPPFDDTSQYHLALTILGEICPPLVIVQHSPRLRLEEQYGSLHRTRVLRQGDNALSFFTYVLSP